MTRLVPAVDRAFDILELFLGEQGELSMPEIVARTCLPRTTVFEIVGTLVARNYLCRTPSHKDRFELGFMSLQLGSAYRRRSRLVGVGQSIAEEVVAACSETVNIALLDGSDVVYVCTVESKQAVRIAISVGRRLPAHCTALGKALLAGLSTLELEDIYPTDYEFKARTQHTVTSFEPLLKELDEVRAQGYAIERDESNEGVSCMAAPIHGENEGVVAAMSVTVPSHRLTDEEELRLLTMVQWGALRVSARLGSRSSQAQLASYSKTGKFGSATSLGLYVEKKEIL